MTLFKRSIFLRLLAIISGMGIMVAIFTSIGHVFFSSKLIDQSVNEQLTNSITLTEDYLENNYTKQISNDLIILASSPQMKRLLSSGKEEYFFNQQDTEKLFLSISKNRLSIYKSIQFIDNKGMHEVHIKSTKRVRTNYSLTNYPDKIEKLDINNIYYNLKSIKENNRIIFSESVSGDRFYAAIYLEDPDIGGFGGIILISFTLTQFIDYLRNFEIFDEPVVWLFTHSGEMLFGDEKNSVNPFPLANKISDKNELSTIKFTKKRSLDSLLSVVKIIISVPPIVRYNLIMNSVYISAMLFIVVTIFSLIIAYFTAKKIIRPIKKVIHYSEKVASGDFSANIPPQGSDEISVLTQSFNTMVKELEDQHFELHALANKDTLTQLPNRRRFEEQLSNAIKVCDRSNNQLAVMYIDLDRFKDVNDTLGHNAGDILIKKVSGRLQKTVRQSDLVARLGGDEFAIIINPHKSVAKTELVAKKILEQLSRPFTIQDNEVFSGASIGISIFPDNGYDYTNIVKHADVAMYKAKSMGRNNYQLYNKELLSSANERVMFGNQVRQALKNQDFTLYYQPKVNLKTREVIGAEALLRWFHQDQFVNPEKIIAIASSTGIMPELDEWVIDTVFTQVEHWKNTRTDFMPISINISAISLKNDNIVHFLTHALTAYDIDPSWIELEITENHFIGNYLKAHTILDTLKNIGFDISIDDFGTGYSSLSYLREIAAHTLKIDRKFVINAMKNKTDRAIATAIVQLARSLDMKVVVEGIETNEQAELFTSLGADSGQGYFFARPMPIEQFIALAQNS